MSVGWASFPHGGVENGWRNVGSPASIGQARLGPPVGPTVRAGGRAHWELHPPAGPTCSSHSAENWASLLGWFPYW